MPRFKPIPDEEGTETRHQRGISCVTRRLCFKPIPDEEGTETADCESDGSHRSRCFKPIPDEEGTETRGDRS